MHSFLRSIGFSNYTNKIYEEKMLNEIMHSNESKIKKMASEEENIKYTELSLEIDENIGITINGQFDEEDRFHMDHYFPYLKSRVISTREELFIGKKSDSDSYTVLCEDLRFGVSLIFYLTNSIDYLKAGYKNRANVFFPAKLAALASEGTILLPTKKSVQDIEESGKEISKRSQMICEAKNGNQEAIDQLTIQEIDIFASIGKRIKNEDVLTIVDRVRNQ